jgi:hypothetical protein
MPRESATTGFLPPDVESDETYEERQYKLRKIRKMKE